MEMLVLGRRALQKYNQPKSSERRGQLGAQQVETPSITPEMSQVSTQLDTARYICPEHGPYMADKDGEMGGCLGCADVKMNISMSRDFSYNALNDNNIVDLTQDLNSSHSGRHGIITHSRFEATKELFDYMAAYESGIKSAGDSEAARQSEIRHNFGILNRRRLRNLSKSVSANLSQLSCRLWRVTSKDDFAMSYRENEVELLLARDVLGRSRSLPEKLEVAVDDVSRANRQPWVTSLHDVST